MSKTPRRWTITAVISYYFQGELVAFNAEHQRPATLAECRVMYRAAKELAIKYDRRYSGSIR